MSTQITLRESQLRNWAVIIRECKESGVNVTEFCNQRGISKHAYYYWFRKVREELFRQEECFVEISDRSEEPHVSEPAVKDTCKEIEIRINNICISVPLSATREQLENVIGAASHAE